MGPICIKNYDKVMEKLSSCEALFDARVFNLDSEEDVLRNIMWRSTYDCVRNSKSRLAHVHVPQKEIQGKSSKELVDLMIESYNVDWHSFPNAFKYGTYLKRVHVDKEGFKYDKGVKTDEKIIVKRTMVKTFSFTMDIPRIVGWRAGALYFSALAKIFLDR
jgi:tRNA(His) 5'-end guanylyltransferase